MAQTSDIDHTSTFGGYATVDADYTVSIPDAVRRCRWIAVDLGARDFALYFAGTSLDRRQIVACFDSAYPNVSAATKLVSIGSSEHAMRHAHNSSTPCWWIDDGGAMDDFEALVWASRIPPFAPGGRGLAFPVHAERGQSGLIVFTGPNLAPAAETLHEIHGRCFSLFEAVARLRPSEAGQLPSMSRRELECLKLTSKGYTSEEIARLLKLSVHTANQYLTQTTQKLNAVNRMHAVAKALRLGLID